MLNLSAASLFCLVVLVGLFVYSGGTIMPATQGADAMEAAQTWMMWGVVVAVPVITGILWVLRLKTPSGR
jgi:hypothetical protein